MKNPFFPLSSFISPPFILSSLSLILHALSKLTYGLSWCVFFHLHLSPPPTAYLLPQSLCFNFSLSIFSPLNPRPQSSNMDLSVLPALIFFSCLSYYLPSSSICMKVFLSHFFSSSSSLPAIINVILLLFHNSLFPLFSNLRANIFSFAVEFWDKFLSPHPPPSARSLHIVNAPQSFRLKTGYYLPQTLFLILQWLLSQAP